MSSISETITTPHQSGRGGHKPQLIVDHIAEGTYEGTKSWFRQSASQVSSHFIVSQEGKICQVVPLDKMAWCNGTVTSSGDSRYFGHSTVPLVRQLAGNANQYSVSIEHEGFLSQTGGMLTGAQLAATAWLHGYIREQVAALYGHSIPPDREHIVGHCEINPKTKPNCPGAAFPWSALIARLNADGEQGADNGGGILYRVQAGAFRSEANARTFLKTVRDEYGYDAFLAPPSSDALYRVQVGAFKGEANARAFLAEVRGKGLDAFLLVGQG